jgi:hypothetical protein
MTNTEADLNMREAVIEFFIEFPDFFYGTLLETSNKEWLEKYLILNPRFSKDKSSWCGNISRNQFIGWSEQFIDKYIDKWDWKLLSGNKALPWSETFIGKYSDKWDWRELSSNESIPWSEQLINTFFDKWNWYDLNRNKSIPWIPNFFNQYNKYWPVPAPSFWPKDLEWNNKFIKEHLNDWKNWEFLSSNEYLPWTENLIDENMEKWDWLRLSQNQFLPWSEKFFYKYIHKWDWRALSSNSKLPWSHEFIDEHIDKWDWFWLSKNSGLPWSESFLKTYIRWIDWNGLSQNRVLPWKDLLTIENNFSIKNLFNQSKSPWFVSFFKKNIDNWNWETFSMLGKNGAFQFSEKIIEKYKDKWSWDLLSRNDSLPWSESFFEKYTDRWDYEKMAINKVLWLSPAFVIKHKQKWKTRRFHDVPIIFQKVFVPYLDENIIQTVLPKIN